MSAPRNWPFPRYDKQGRIIKPPRPRKPAPTYPPGEPAPF
jgi:hypothetical protein